MPVKRILLSLFLVLLFNLLNAQDVTPKNLKIFLDCDDCDFSYFRRFVNYAEFVRSQQLAKIIVLVTRQETGSGGSEFYLNFTGIEEYAEINYTLTFTSEAFYTEVEQRDGLLETLKLGLVPYLLESNVPLDLLDFKYDNGFGPEDITTFNPEDDPWNYWVFRLSGSGRAEIQEQQSSLRLRGELNADRITEQFKFRSRFRYSILTEEFEDDGETIENLIERIDANVNGVYSLGPKWSMAAEVGYNASTFNNIQNSYEINGGIEYNIFDWDESDRRVFTVSYMTAYVYNEYIETTIFDKTNEQINRHQLRSNLRLQENWGGVEVSLIASTFVHDPSLYRISLNGGASIRLTKNLSVWSEVEVASIHDQIFLPQEDLTREEILLQQRQLRTDFSLSYNLGLSLTFGSIYNNVVNPRF